MAMTPAERQRAFRERQKIRMAEDPEYAVDVKSRKAESDRRYYEKTDKELWNKRTNENYHKRMAIDPDYRQLKRDEAKAYVERYPERVSARKKKYREENAEAIAKYMAQWEFDNRDKRYALNYKRRMTIAAATELVLRSVVWERDKGVCGLCSQEVEGPWEMDHIIPLSKGGSHTYDNVQVSHPKCNHVKYNKILI